jgi:hypothetical protein
MLVVLPAGEVSSFQFGSMRVEDRAWNPAAVALAKMTKATVVPMYIHGSNGLGFHAAGRFTRGRERPCWSGNCLIRRGGRRGSPSVRRSARRAFPRSIPTRMPRTTCGGGFTCCGGRSSGHLNSGATGPSVGTPVSGPVQSHSMQEEIRALPERSDWSGRADCRCSSPMPARFRSC